MFNLTKLANSQRLFLFNNIDRSFNDFVIDINHYRARIRRYKQTAAAYNLSKKPLKIVLFHADTYQFSVRLFALSAESFDIYFPNNGQVETLNSLAEIAVAFSGYVDHALQIPSIESTEFNIDGDCYVDANLDSNSNSIVKENSELRPLNINSIFTWPEAGNLYFSTSGSTGEPKFVNKTWPQLNAELVQLQNTFSITRYHKVIATVSHQHIYGLLFRLLWPLSIGATIADSFDYPEHINASLNSEQPVVLISSPAFLKRLVSDNVLVEQSRCFSHIVSSGGALVDDVAITLKQQLNIAITQVYGSTETGGIAYRQVDSLPAAKWQTFTGITLSQAQDSKRLILQSPWVQESSMLLDDTGELTSPTQFILYGRIDRNVKLEEKRVNLSAMEHLMNEHAWVNESRIILKLGKRDVLFAIVSLTALGSVKQHQLSAMLFTRALKNHLLGKFELVCLPKKWRYVSELPYNSQGKLVQSELEQMFE
ncbi:AMP-binding protein [Colwellia piezophila]|uniref:AMP-binding protein n=1 Tax=Colwellia piezophila TaxID=211668 RepID=UPI000373665E|nr:AMP-binding protein [Colwellia piezophila]